MSTEDEMTIDEGHKYLRRMKKRCIQAGRKEQERLLVEMEVVTDLHPLGRKPQEPDPADEREPGMQTALQATKGHLRAADRQRLARHR